MRRGFRFWRIWRDGTRPIGAALRRVTVQALTMRLCPTASNRRYVDSLKHWQSLDILADNGAMHIARAYTRSLGIGMAYGKRSTHPLAEVMLCQVLGLVWLVSLVRGDRRARHSRRQSNGGSDRGRSCSIASSAL